MLHEIWSNYLIPIADILLIAYIFYRALLLIQGTRAVQIIIGILTLVVITVVAEAVLRLNTLSWLLNKFWIAAPVILVVVFQPEIRSMLAQLGSHRWSRMLFTSQQQFIDEIIDAVKDCALHNVGALMALEQEIGLRTQIETGTIINGEVSKELIQSIVNIKSPLHDGAIIIQNNRLIAAGCLLPLTSENGILKILGTRHRAAVGLSEISDALVIVVSEETGGISVARNGKLETNLESADLRRRLKDLYAQRANSLLRKVHQE
jgi:diadenylate cyclase